MTTPAPLVSIVTPLYNCRAYFPETAASILAQTLTSWEWIVVDDGSTDGSAELLRDLAAQDPRIVPVFQPRNGGVAAARNTGFAKARGAYVAFVDSDDKWSPDKLQAQTELMQANDYKFSYTDYARVLPDGQGSKLHVVTAPDQMDYKRLLRETAIAASSVMIRRDAVNKGDHLFPPIPHEDYACWLRILKKGIVAHRLPRVAMYYRVRGDSLSADKIESIRRVWRIYRTQEKLGVLRAALCLASYLFHAIWKRIA